MSARNSCRDGILDAAEAVASERGALHVTLEAVADRARVSKGGLLYHFPSKDALLQAMLERLIERFGADQEAVFSQNPAGADARLRAFIEAGAREQPDARPVAAALLAAGAINPGLLDPVRAMHRKSFERLSAPARNKPLVWVIMMAIDGLWLNDIMRTSPLTPDHREQLRAELVKLAAATC